MKNAIHQSCRRLLAAVALLLAVLLTAPAALAQATITYFHNDAAGTPWLATNQAGTVLWKENYLPYGYRQKVEPASADNKLWFTGKPYDPDTGMTYMGARYYMPLLGRFTGMDPKEMNPEQIHSFNRYAYANNNPNSYIDPDGKLAETVWDAFNISLGFQSLVSNVQEGNWSGATVDAAGIAIDGVAAAIPVVPGGAGIGLSIYRAKNSASSIIPITKAKFGHTFTVHGQNSTDFLTKRAAGSGLPTGQFLDDQTAARLISDNLNNLKNGAISVPIPPNFPARIIMPNGKYVPATSVRIVPSTNGVKTAYPEL